MNQYMYVTGLGGRRLGVLVGLSYPCRHESVEMVVTFEDHFYRCPDCGTLLTEVEAKAIKDCLLK